MSASTKKRLLWAGGILLALVVLAVGMGVYYAGQAKRTLDQVTQRRFPAGGLRLCAGR